MEGCTARRAGSSPAWRPFATALDCADIEFLPDGPLPLDRVGTIVGIDLNKQRIRAALSSALILAPAPGEFTTAESSPRSST